MSVGQPKMSDWEEETTKLRKKRKMNPLKPPVKILTVLSARDAACFSWLGQPNYFNVNAPQGAPPLVSLGPLQARDVPYEDCRTQEQIVLCVNFLWIEGEKEKNERRNRLYQENHNL